MQNGKEKIIQAPDELEFLQKVSQMTNEEEIKKAEEEYLTLMNAYFDQLRKSRTKNSNQ